MRRHWTLVSALVVSLSFAASVPTADAQRVARNHYQNRGMSPGAGAAIGPAAEEFVEELPVGRGRAAAEYPPGRFIDERHGFPHAPHSHEFYPGGGWHDDVWLEDGCGVPSSAYWGMASGPPSRGQFFFTADYLNVKASFSDATAFIDRQFVNGTTSFDFHQLDFDSTSSYRFGGGYRLCECGEELRFMHTRLKSSAAGALTPEAITGVGFRHIIPFKPPQFPGGRVDFAGEVDVKTFDWEWAKTIPLGGMICGGCADPCMGQCGGCCDPCAMPCPAWDITWSAGIRYAEADWFRRWTSFGTANQPIGGALSTMDFRGIGAKVGFEGRRYFFDSGWLSAYAKGDLSLLWGRLDLATFQQDQLDLPAEITVSNRIRQIIPVTELEAGVTAQVTHNARISAGYLLSAWHDLGYRDDFVNDLVFPIIYDDANILGFHGWFLQAEVSY